MMSWSLGDMLGNALSWISDVAWRGVAWIVGGITLVVGVVLLIFKGISWGMMECGQIMGDVVGDCNAMIANVENLDLTISDSLHTGFALLVTLVPVYDLFAYAVLLVSITMGLAVYRLIKTWVPWGS